MTGKIRVDTNGQAVAKYWNIYLDDIDISNFVAGLSISTTVGNLPRVHLDIVGYLELPNEIEGLVEIYKQMKLVHTYLLVSIENVVATDQDDVSPLIGEVDRCSSTNAGTGTSD